MPAKRLSTLVTKSYAAVRATGLLENPWAQRAFVSSYFLYKRVLEDPFAWLAAAHPQLFRGGDVFDIGANIGYTASVFARVTNVGRKVYAFEPDSTTFKTLVDVIGRRRLSATVEAVHSAVGSAEGELSFWHNQAHVADHRVVTERFRAAGVDDRLVTSVPATTVDAFVAARRIERVAFIKIDVQGYELAVCEGMHRTLEAVPDACVCFEYAPQSMAELGFVPAQLLDFFTSRGFHMYLLAKSSLRAADAAAVASAAASGYVDVLCTRRSLV